MPRARRSPTAARRSGSGRGSRFGLGIGPRLWASALVVPQAGGGWSALGRNPRRISARHDRKSEPPPWPGLSGASHLIAPLGASACGRVGRMKAFNTRSARGRRSPAVSRALDGTRPMTEDGRLGCDGGPAGTACAVIRMSLRTGCFRPPATPHRVRQRITTMPCSGGSGTSSRMTLNSSSPWPRAPTARRTASA